MILDMHNSATRFDAQQRADIFIASPGAELAPIFMRSSSSFSHSGVSTTPGAKALTVIPLAAKALAAEWVRLITAALLAE